jgi:ParB family chromosome partitioning protein
MMDARRRALGRGLGALIPGAGSSAPAPRTEEHEHSASIDAIVPNPYQPREQFNEDAIEELAASIREKGLLQPLLVRKRGHGYELIAGERRFRAARRAGLTHVPIIVRDASDSESLELALIENLQRENLNPVEEARAYQRLADEFALAQEEIARRVGKTRSAVANSIRILHLPAEVLAQLEAGVITAGHARSLLALDSAHGQVAAAREVVAGGLTVRDTERLVRERGQPPPIDIEQRAVESDLTRALGTRVKLRHGKDGSGRIVIQYYSLDELNGLIARLSGGH